MISRKEVNNIKNMPVAYPDQVNEGVMSNWYIGVVMQVHNLEENACFIDVLPTDTRAKDMRSCSYAFEVPVLYTLPEDLLAASKDKQLLRAHLEKSPDHPDKEEHIAGIIESIDALVENRMQGLETVHTVG